ncbi:hypothetical protein BU17DRAFT_40924 [Hysterangium stoloniferum]|nr:hypothetical protein BU17DRAFT_40924 [Hysterangium stoloniferum]
MTVSSTTPKTSKLPVSTRKSTKNAVATLRSLYPRAARAFLQRDVALTHSLLLSAFSNLQPPLTSTLDPLSFHRRKWDILRITLETTLYTSGQASKSLPGSLQTILMLSPPSIIATMHGRSIQLFTPANRERPSSEFLPSQILLALALASVKLECVQVGREIVEDWLTRRSQTGYEGFKHERQVAEELEGYEKVLEVYCLHILPRLNDWEYAREFLRYENELGEDRRMVCFRSGAAVSLD